MIPPPDYQLQADLKTITNSEEGRFALGKPNQVVG